jgi:hypothetical protein
LFGSPVSLVTVAVFVMSWSFLWVVAWGGRGAPGARLFEQRDELQPVVK